MNAPLTAGLVLGLASLGLAPLWSSASQDSPATPEAAAAKPRAKNAVLFVGDGMGVSTVTAARIFANGVAGQLQLDRMPYTAMSRTYTADYITADSAGTMTSMVTGQKANSGMVGLDATTERGDWARDGDGAPLTTVFEMAKAEGKRIGLVTTACITHATPASCYAKLNERDRQVDIAPQLVPGTEEYNLALGEGVDVLMGGGRWYFRPGGEEGPEGELGRRRDGRDLIASMKAAGYRYCWNTEGFNAIPDDGGKVLALFEADHMEYEHDRPGDRGGEPSLEQMAVKALELLDGSEEGFLLMIEGGRIDHAHHSGNPHRALVDTVEFDQALAAILARVDLDETLVLATADHSHVFNVAGYPLRPASELSYELRGQPEEWQRSKHSGLMGYVHGIDRGEVRRMLDAHGEPYTALLYANGPGYRRNLQGELPEGPLLGFGGAPVDGPGDPNYRPVAGLPLSSETHGGEDVVLYAAGAGAERVHGTVENTFVFDVLVEVLGL